MKRPRKRTLLMVLLLLTYSGGGTIINVAVAWGCVARSISKQPILSTYLQNDQLQHELARAEARGWKAQPIQGPVIWRLALLNREWFGMTRFDVAETDGQETQDDTSLTSIEAGVPFRALSGHIQRNPLSLAGLTERNTFLQIPLELSIPSSRRGMLYQQYLGLPLVPLWPGFAINTIFYAAILWLLFAAPGFVKRRIRARRGQCPACAYPIGASDVCTECGAAVRE